MLNAVINALPKLLSGLLVTLQMVVGSLILGFIIGIVLTICRMYGGRILGFFAWSYIRVIRSIPTIVLVLMLYLVIRDIIDLSPLGSVILALGLHSGAYQAEILRSALASVSPGDIKAGKTLGMSGMQIFVYIIFPQLMLNALPSWSNEITIVLKETSIGFVVGASEMFRQANLIAAVSRDHLLMYSLVGAIYLILTISVNRGLSYVEKRYATPNTR